MEIVFAAMASLIVVEGLCLLACNFFWSKQVDKMVDKLMSRNFAEYEQVKNLPTVERVHRVPIADNAEDLGTINGVSVF